MRNLQKRGARLLWAVLFVSSWPVAVLGDTAPGDMVDPSTFPEVVARVGGEAIDKETLIQQAGMMRQAMLRGGAPDPAGVRQFYLDVLDGLIGELLFLQHARAEGLGASPEEAAAELAKLEARFEGEGGFERMLEARGLSRQRFIGQLRQEISIERLIDRDIRSGLTFTEAEKRAFYEKFKDDARIEERRRFRHILLRFPAEVTPEQKADVLRRAEELRQRALAGDDFAALAGLHSEDELSKSKGGELPWLVRAENPTALDRVAFTLEPGQIGKLAESPVGVHIVELLEVEPGRLRSFEELEGQIEGHLSNERIQAGVQRKVEELKKTTKIEVLI